ncbi:type II toxin-antitoxin system RelE/ParE family toxin [Rhodopseudomonas palustris]|uniref:type II toxin-antitoxin system RelE/ParE family toxin n=1 Tax=Rhodopseudomonas palustris TaxID=1076 RepID=UPI0032E02638
MFLFGFAKSARGNIDDDELATAQEIAQIWLDADPSALDKALADGIIVEIGDGDEEN